MALKLSHVLTISAAVVGSVVLGGASALAGVGGGCGVPVAEPMSIAAFVTGLAALYVVKKRRNKQ